MEQYPSDNFIPQREPNEVTLEYVAEPKPYVAYYVQDRPLPGRKPETAAQAQKAPAQRLSAGVARVVRHRVHHLREIARRHAAVRAEVRQRSLPLRQQRSRHLSGAQAELLDAPRRQCVVQFLRRPLRDVRERQLPRRRFLPGGA